MKKILTIIIVHWNTADKLKTLLKLINNDAYQIIVVDNASTTKLDWIKKEFPDIELIENKFNRGYSFTCNQGVTKAVGEWLLFLNPDVEITPQQIEKLVEFSKKNELDVCSIKTNDSYQKPIPSALSLFVEFSPLNKAQRFLASLGMTGSREKTIFGGGFLIKKSVFLSVGGFDERFFLWFEDSDLSKRLTDNNHKIGWLDLPIKHSGGESFKQLDKQQKRDIFFQSMDIYAKKHFSFFGQLIVSFIKKRYSSRKLLPPLQNLISITIPNLKVNLLESFFKNNSLSSQVEWIVVTSSIEQSQIWKWRLIYPLVRFISVAKNFGFASTVNIGFRVSSGKWLGTINDDMQMNSNWWGELSNLKEQKIGSFNPIIKRVNGETESAGIKVHLKGKAETLKSVHKNNQVDATNAAAVIYSKEALNTVGIFDERFGSYLEDIDLSLRLKHSGFENIVSNKSEVIHAGQSTSQDLKWQKNYLDFKNWILVILKNWSLQDLILNFPSIFIERLRNMSGLLKAVLN